MDSLDCIILYLELAEFAETVPISFDAASWACRLGLLALLTHGVAAR